MNANRMVFLNIGWMEHYEGLPPESKDYIEGGGEFVKEKGWGHEIYNFKPLDGYMYGFVETVIKNGEMSTIAIENIDEEALGWEYLENVLVIWTANHPSRPRTYVVGWYKNAIVYREVQDDIERYYRHDKICYKIPYYFTKAKEEDCKLVPASRRSMVVNRVQTYGEGWMGRSNVWYANSPTPDIQGYREAVIEYILNY